MYMFQIWIDSELYKYENVVEPHKFKHNITGVYVHVVICITTMTYNTSIRIRYRNIMFKQISGSKTIVDIMKYADFVSK